MHSMVKLTNRVGNRFSKRRRHKMLGFGRFRAVFEALKKAPTTYGGAWQSTAGVSQGGVWGPPESLLCSRNMIISRKKTKSPGSDTPLGRRIQNARRNMCAWVYVDVIIRKCYGLRAK